MTFKKQTEALSERTSDAFQQIRFDSSDNGDTKGEERWSSLYRWLSFSTSILTDSLLNDISIQSLAKGNSNPSKTLQRKMFQLCDTFLMLIDFYIWYLGLRFPKRVYVLYISIECRLQDMSVWLYGLLSSVLVIVYFFFLTLFHI